MMDKKECTEEERLFLYMDGELDHAERPAMEAHLGTCGTCSAELAKYRTLERGARREVPVPEDFTPNVLRSLESPGPGWSFAAALAVLLVALLAIETLPPSLVAGAGEILSSLIVTLKNLKIMELLEAMFSQNLPFLAGYSLIMACIIAIHALMKSRKPPHSHAFS